MDKEIIRQRVADLREVMKRERIDAFIFPSTDPHNGEYVPDHWKGREFISGFDGSAGIAVVTMEAAALWTDSRYFIHAAEVLEGTGYALMKQKIEGTPTIAQWLGQKLATVSSPEVALDGTVNSFDSVEQLKSELQHQGGITLRTNFDPLDIVWKDRPAIPTGKVEMQPIEFAGESAESKMRRVRDVLKKRNIDGMLVSALDDIAWTLNMRGSDVHCNPVFVSYLLISQDSATLYINKGKLTMEIITYLTQLGVSIADYSEVASGLKAFDGYNILMDGGETSYTLVKAVGKSEIVFGDSPIQLMKIVKNEAEIEGYHNAMLRDGVAMVKFLRWLKPAVEAGGQTEMSIDRKLTSLRAEQPLYRDISFDTIAGYGKHGAIVHYEANEETDIPLEPKGLILIDSGAQYQDGTTDITRTIALGGTTDKEKHVYTLVLKGHLRLQNLKFPKGASGTQLDAIARSEMWREGYNYLHGTGHGVGSYLNVHEGSHQIRMEWKPTPLVAGMTVTNEPGLYLENEFGVRTENTMLIKDYMETDFGSFLQFEPLTLCPIDKTPIDISMMTDEEIGWLNDYHAMVYVNLAPLLDGEDLAWLKEACAPITHN